LNDSLSISRGLWSVVCRASVAITQTQLKRSQAKQSQPGANIV